jgi:hypothetical protein
VPSVQSRVLFVALIVTGDSRLHFGWRLLGPNNRELGRGSNAAMSVEDCAHEASALSGQRNLIEFVHRRERSNDGWTWSGNLNQGEIVHSSRSFRRERESRYNVDAFAEALATAEVRVPDDISRLPQVSSSLFVPQSIDLTAGALARANGGKAS